MASRRRGRDLALARRRAARSDDLRERPRCGGASSRARAPHEPAAADRGAGGRMADRDVARRLYAGRLLGCAGLRVRRLRDGAEGLAADAAALARVQWMWLPPLTSTSEPVT